MFDDVISSFFFFGLSLSERISIDSFVRNWKLDKRALDNKWDEQI